MQSKPVPMKEEVMSSLTIGIGCYLVGVFTWTLAEYLLHSKLGHKKKKKNPFTVEHIRHHRDTDYFAKTSKKLLAATIVLCLATPIVGMILTWLIGFTFAFGLSSMYLVYELLHRRAHTHGPQGPYGRWLRKHHFHHHFKNPKVNHGVTSPVWDIVFGTLEKPEKVKVPRKLALEWQIDPATGEIWPQYQQDYELRGGTTAAL